MEPLVEIGQVSAAVVGWLAVVWVCLIILSNSALLLSKLIRKLRTPTKKPFLSVPFPQTRLDYSPASERRRKILSFLEEFSGRDVPLVEFREVPPGYEAPIRRQFSEEQIEPYWQIAHLKWQLTSDKYLLAERVTDAIEHFRRMEFKDAKEDFMSAVFLERAPLNGRKEGMAWQVVIETNFANYLADQIVSIKEWLGIAVEIREASPNLLHGKCQMGGDGRNGVVAGEIQTQSRANAMGLACQHYLSSDCASLVWPTFQNNPGPAYDNSTPDIALLDLRSPCFGTANRTAAYIRAATELEIEQMLSRGSLLQKSPRSLGGVGKIDSTGTTAFMASGRLYRGPHLQIAPYFYRKWGVVWPVFHRRFSRPGHSGSWIIDRDQGVWVGMVVAGKNPPNVGTWAIPGWFIEDVLKHRFQGAITARLFD